MIWLTRARGRGGSRNPGTPWLPAGAIALTILLLVSLPPAREVQASSNAQLTLLESNTNRIVLEFDVTGYDSRDQVVSGATFAALSISGLGHTGDPGKPQLPIRGAMIGIPPTAQPSLKILADETRIDALPHPPLPAPREQVQIDPRQLLPRDEGTVYAPDAAGYSSNQSYPAAAARIASSGNWRSQRYVTVEFHPLQYNGAARQLTFHRLIRVEVTLNYPGGKAPQLSGSAVNEGPFEQLLQQSVINYATAKSWRSKTAPARAPAPRGPAPYSSGSWYKVAVDADGIYQITCAQLVSAGINKSSLVPSTLKLFKQEGVQQLAINVVGSTWSTNCDSSDYVEFFGQAPDAKYTKTNIYWLTFGGAAGKRMATRAVNGTGGTATTTYTNTLHLEQNLLYRGYVPMVDGVDHWYWNWVVPVYGYPTASYTSTLTNLATGTYSATLQVAATGYTKGQHHTQVSVNGNQIDDAIWNGAVVWNKTINFSPSYLTTDANTIQVKELNDLDPNDFIFTNYFNLGYTSAFAASGDQMRFAQPLSGNWQYQIDGFSNSSVETFDITDSLNPLRLTQTTVTTSSLAYTLQFTDATASPREYLALTTAQRLTPLSITADTPSDLHNQSNGADYIIISYGPFIPNLQLLIDLRSSQFSGRVKVVDVQDVYDEFSDGLVDAQAIRDFLAYAYSDWSSPAPSFVLLVGDGTYDPKGYCEVPGVCLQDITPPDSTFIPPYLRLVDPWAGETASDSRLVAFDDALGNPMPLMSIGRLPAESTTDVDAMVRKIVNYERTPAAGSWKTNVTFVADDPDGAGDFWGLSDLIANDPHYLPPSYHADKIYYQVPPYTTPSSMHNAVLSAINAGSLIVNYVGHSTQPNPTSQWSGDDYFGVNDLGSLTNGSKIPIMLEMTCWTGFFTWPGSPSLAEANVRLSNGGAVASWAASGEGVGSGHDLLDRGFFDAVMNQGTNQLGIATDHGKMNLWLNGAGANLDLIDTFTLLGDPAMRLPLGNSALHNYYLPFVKH